MVLDGGRPALFYRTAPRSGEEGWRTNYIHPLWSLNGAVLTEDGPGDHPHQRGLYWAWRRILIDGARVADGWVGEGLELDTVLESASLNESGDAAVRARVSWRLASADGREPILEERVLIRVEPTTSAGRVVSIEVELAALRAGVSLAGTDDEKGYGGPSIRLAHPEDLVLSSVEGPLVARLGPVEVPGGEVQFSWRDASPGWPSRITATCEVDGNPWKAWVLRQEPSMQNCAVPGREPVSIQPGAPLRLSLRLVHD